jgi:hypothetical protein
MTEPTEYELSNYRAVSQIIKDLKSPDPLSEDDARGLAFLLKRKAKFEEKYMSPPKKSTITMYKVAPDWKIYEIEIAKFHDEYPESYVVLLNGSSREISNSHTKWCRTEEEAVSEVIRRYDYEIAYREDRLERMKNDKINFIGLLDNNQHIITVENCMEYSSD